MRVDDGVDGGAGNSDSLLRGRIRTPGTNVGIVMECDFMRRILLSLLTATFFQSAAVAASSVEVMPPSDVRGLRGTVIATVSGRDLVAPGTDLVVRIRGSDVTSSVVTASTVTMAQDTNADGTYEAYAEEFTLDLSTYAFADAPIEFEGVGVTSGGTISSYRSSRMKLPGEVGSPDTWWVPSVSGTSLEYSVRLQGIEIDSKEYKLFLNGTEVTSSVSISESIVWDDTSNGVTNDRLYEVVVDASGLSCGVGDELSFRATVTYLMNAVQYVKTFHAAIVKKSDPTEAAARMARAKACVETFVANSTITKGGGETTVGGDPAAHASALRTSLLACVPPFGGVAEFTLSNGMTVKLGFGAEAAGGSDLCIAIGADAGSTERTGGNATATNSQTGGAAIAIGGNGRTSSPASGGSGTATSNGGTAVAEGGQGGTEGGPGGSATATNKGGNSKTSKAKGGNGGAPPGSGQKGGSGGDAKATSGTAGGGNWPGGAGEVGKFGYGGTAVTSGGSGTGSVAGGQGNN